MEQSQVDVENKRLQEEGRCQSSIPAPQPHWMDEEMGGATLSRYRPKQKT